MSSLWLWRRQTAVCAATSSSSAAVRANKLDVRWPPTSLPAALLLIKRQTVTVKGARGHLEWGGKQLEPPHYVKRGRISFLLRRCRDAIFSGVPTRAKKSEFLAAGAHVTEESWGSSDCGVWSISSLPMHSPAVQRKAPRSQGYSALIDVCSLLFSPSRSFSPSYWISSALAAASSLLSAHCTSTH